MVLVLGFVGLFFSKLVLANRLSTEGGEIAILLERQEILEERKQILENQIAAISSLEYIREQAQGELGMQPATEFEFLVPPRLASLP